MKVPSDDSGTVKKTRKNGFKRPDKRFKELFGDSGDEVRPVQCIILRTLSNFHRLSQEKSVTAGFTLPETWEEYRLLARQFSKRSSTSSDITSEASKTSESLKRYGVPVAQAGGGQRDGSADGTPVSTPGTGPPEVPTTSDRPKRACRLKRKHGKLV